MYKIYEKNVVILVCSFLLFFSTIIFLSIFLKDIISVDILHTSLCVTKIVIHGPKGFKNCLQLESRGALKAAVYL